MEDKFESQLKSFGIELSEIKKQKFHQYYELLNEWNKVMNLTAITERDEVYEKHFVDSLSLVKAVDMNHFHTLIDVGTGAGFPGIPLKIVFPHLNVLLIDSLGKRVKFLNHVINELELQKISALHGRAEDYAKNVEYREKFDICVSRAVANLSTLCEYCLPYVKVGGVFVAYKSENIDDELNQSQNVAKVLGGEIKDVIQFRFSENNIGRTLIKIAKNNDTDKKYPRKAGMPLKNPIK